MVISPELLLAHLPKGPVVVEAGAWRGFDTVKLALSAERVYAFEPVPMIYKMLCAETWMLSNVRATCLALGEHNERRRMWVTEGQRDASSSLLQPKLHLLHFPGIEFNRQIEVEVSRLDTWARLQDVERIDGLWLDAQGSDLAILKGMGSLLDGVQALVLEIATTELYEGMPFKDEVLGWLKGEGFSIAFAEEEGSHYGNALLTR